MGLKNKEGELKARKRKVSNKNSSCQDETPLKEVGMYDDIDSNKILHLQQNGKKKSDAQKVGQKEKQNKNWMLSNFIPTGSKIIPSKNEETALSGGEPESQALIPTTVEEIQRREPCEHEDSGIQETMTEKGTDYFSFERVNLENECQRNALLLCQYKAEKQAELSSEKKDLEKEVPEIEISQEKKDLPEKYAENEDSESFAEVDNVLQEDNIVMEDLQEKNAENEDSESFTEVDNVLQEDKIVMEEHCDDKDQNIEEIDVDQSDIVDFGEKYEAENKEKLNGKEEIEKEEIELPQKGKFQLMGAKAVSEVCKKLLFYGGERGTIKPREICLIKEYFNIEIKFALEDRLDWIKDGSKFSKRSHKPTLELVIHKGKAKRRGYKGQRKIKRKEPKRRLKFVTVHTVSGIPKEVGKQPNARMCSSGNQKDGTRQKETNGNGGKNQKNEKNRENKRRDNGGNRRNNEEFPNRENGGGGDDRDKKEKKPPQDDLQDVEVPEHDFKGTRKKFEHHCQLDMDPIVAFGMLSGEQREGGNQSLRKILQELNHCFLILLFEKQKNGEDDVVPLMDCEACLYIDTLLSHTARCQNVPCDSRCKVVLRLLKYHVWHCHTEAVKAMQGDEQDDELGAVSFTPTPAYTCRLKLCEKIRERLDEDLQMSLVKLQRFLEKEWHRVQGFLSVMFGMAIDYESETSDIFMTLSSMGNLADRYLQAMPPSSLQSQAQAPPSPSGAHDRSNVPVHSTQMRHVRPHLSPLDPKHPANQTSPSLPPTGLLGLATQYTSLPLGPSRRGQGNVAYGHPLDIRNMGKHWEGQKNMLLDGKKINVRKEEGIILNEYGLRSMLIINNGRYEKDCQWLMSTHLGTGMSGQCYLAEDMVSETIFCVKEIDIYKFKYAELEIWSQLQHPHVLKLYGAIRDEETIFIFSEFIDGGSLQEVINIERQLNSWTALSYLKQLLEVLVYLEKRRVIHEDLKADNILLRAHSTDLVVCDFGLAKCFDTEPQRVRPNQPPVGGPTQWAPEKAAGRGYSYKSDLWAVCCMMIHMLSGHPPWVLRFPAAVVLPYVIDKNPAPIEDIPTRVQSDIRDLIIRGLEKEESARPSAAALSKDPAFSILETRNPGSISFIGHINRQADIEYNQRVMIEAEKTKELEKILSNVDLEVPSLPQPAWTTPSEQGGNPGQAEPYGQIIRPQLESPAEAEANVSEPRTMSYRSQASEQFNTMDIQDLMFNARPFEDDDERFDSTFSDYQIGPGNVDEYPDDTVGVIPNLPIFDEGDDDIIDDMEFAETSGSHAMTSLRLPVEHDEDDHINDLQLVGGDATALNLQLSPVVNQPHNFRRGESEPAVGTSFNPPPRSPKSLRPSHSMEDRPRRLTPTQQQTEELNKYREELAISHLKSKSNGDDPEETEAVLRSLSEESDEEGATYSFVVDNDDSNRQMSEEEQRELALANDIQAPMGQATVIKFMDVQGHELCRARLESSHQKWRTVIQPTAEKIFEQGYEAFHCLINDIIIELEEEIDSAGQNTIEVIVKSVNGINNYKWKMMSHGREGAEFVRDPESMFFG